MDIVFLVSTAALLLDPGWLPLAVRSCGGPQMNILYVSRGGVGRAEFLLLAPALLKPEWSRRRPR